MRYDWNFYELTGNMETTLRFKTNYEEIMCVNFRILLFFMFIIMITFIGLKNKIKN